ncbi:class I SAM-dependent methyltransferase [Bauldia sp.]|uniref:class I SAM-dependent methyltransferase n=1 Tax=Bauldia sp. TaxID=2575872 RepID=UPI003BA936F8
MSDGDRRRAPEFTRRREAILNRVGDLGRNADDLSWFDAVYGGADGDPAQVPWADLGPKEGLPEWLAQNPGDGRSALDVGCGLGDNAEALAAAGYATTGFDLSETAIGWAKQRFPDSPVEYVTADLFQLPEAWRGGFDLVFECFTIQALEGAPREQAFATIADLVAPGGRLLAITITRDEDVWPDGPPWPLASSEIARFDDLGLQREDETAYDVVRHHGRRVPHMRLTYRKPA